MSLSTEHAWQALSQTGRRFKALPVVQLNAVRKRRKDESLN